MTLSPIVGPNTQTLSNAKPTAASKLQIALNTINSVLGNTHASDTLPALSLAVQLQANTAGLKQVSSNLAQTASRVQVAEAGTKDIRKNLQDLQTLAKQATDTNLSVADRKALGSKAQTIITNIDKIVGNTTFGGNKLLDGSLSGKGTLSLEKIFTPTGAPSHANPGDTLSIGNLSSSSLLGAKSLDLSSAASATKALATVTSAVNTVTSTIKSADTLSSAIDHIAAHFAAAQANIAAAQSNFQPTDFSQGSQFSLLNLQANVAQALAAHSPNLSNLTSLIG